MSPTRPAFRFARFEDVRGMGLPGWYALLDGAAGVGHAVQLVFLRGFRRTDGPRSTSEFDTESADAVDVNDQRSSWTGPFGTAEEARAEGRRLSG